MIRALALALLVATPAAAQGLPFAPAVRQTVEEAVVPGYAAFTLAANAEAATVTALCDDPGEATLAEARARFDDLVGAFSAVELYRFGPAREDNRIERLFFWPDPRGRALAQVQAVIAEEDASATDPATLRAKSVAVQGLPALEFALFGTGSDTLASSAGFRCRYAAAVADAVAETARALEAAWRGPFAAVIEAAGEGGDVYRSHGEALEDILGAAADELQLVAAMKLGAVIGDTPAAAKPKLAPFWRSGNTVTAMIGNLEGVKAVLGDPLRRLLGEDGHLVDSARFQIGQAEEALAAVTGPWTEAVRDEEAHRRLRFAALQIEGARRTLVDGIETELGLVKGFNESDGD